MSDRAGWAGLYGPIRDPIEFVLLMVVFRYREVLIGSEQVQLQEPLDHHTMWKENGTAYGTVH